MDNFQHAVVFDIETFPNCMTMHVEGLFSDFAATFEISQYRDDRVVLLQWFNYWHEHQIPMIGFNSVGFDYSVLHQLWLNPYALPGDLYEHAMTIIGSLSRFGHQVFESDRFAPQIDLYKIHHFDNRAKATSLKALQINMRSPNVVECPLPFGVPLTREQIDTLLIPYNKHDVRETKRFAHISMDAIKFRLGLRATLHGDVLNFADGKVGRSILQQRLGDELCFERDELTGRRSPRQTHRTAIRLADIIFPYVQFRNAEFNRILSWMRQQTLTADDIEDADGEPSSIRTKGVFSGVSANVGGLDFYFGTGGIHGSVASRRFAADAEHAIQDIDVASLYPNIAIQNGLFPAHLGATFVDVYAGIPRERKQYGKGTVENSTLKLASNVPYGDSNNKYSFMYDPQFTMTITINGQLMLCMLAESLLTVPTLQIIQINTDGITYRVHRSQVEHARIVQRIWERTTRLVLEEASYSRMWIRDVNNYVAEGVDGKLKQKGVYWFPRKFPDDISNSSPPAWHKDFSGVVSVKAAVEHMVTGVDIERFVHSHADPFDFMCRAKVDRSSKLLIGDAEVQRTTRYYVAHNGGEMRKISPPVKGARVGDFKRRNGVSDHEYHTILQSLPPGSWDERIHTKNKSRYVIREMSIESGFKVADCNVAAHFDFENLNYGWYIERARKLVVG